MLNIQVLVDDASVSRKCASYVGGGEMPKLRVREDHQARAFKAPSRIANATFVREGAVLGSNHVHTVFEGHHQPLKVWVLCLYFMVLNLSNRQIAKEVI